MKKNETCTFWCIFIGVAIAYILITGLLPNFCQKVGMPYQWGLWFNPIFTLAMVMLLLWQNQANARRHEEKIDEIKKNREHEILFKLLDDYTKPEMSDAIRRFREAFNQAYKKHNGPEAEYDENNPDHFLYDIELHHKCKGADEELHQAFRQILYFWRKVAIAKKHIGAPNIFSAFHNGDILNLFIPTFYGVTILCNQVHSLVEEDDMELLRREYYDEQPKELISSPKQIEQAYDSLIMKGERYKELNIQEFDDKMLDERGLDEQQKIDLWLGKLYRGKMEERKKVYQKLIELKYTYYTEPQRMEVLNILEPIPNRTGPEAHVYQAITSK